MKGEKKMNDGQAKFFEYMVDCIQNDKKEEGTLLLEKAFQNQADASFGVKELEDFNAQILEMIKPEHLKEVKDILNKFGKSHIVDSDSKVN
jgi:hypothetical protein